MLKFGDKVELNPESRWSHVGEENPLGVQGVVILVRKYEDDGESLNIQVAWDVEHYGYAATNTYREDDLIKL